VIRKLRTSAVDAGQPLAAWLALRLGMDAEAARGRVSGGAVYVDGRRVRDPDLPLAAGQRIAVHPEPASTGTAWRVVHEDADVVVVEKPAGLPVTSARGGGGALDAEVAARFPGATLVHRIDRDTSGLVLFARGRAARQRLAGALERREMERLYVAAVLGAPPEEMRLDATIGPDPADPRRMRAGVSGGDAALSLVRVRGRGDGRALVEVRLVTGRTHQIRVHLSAAGFPILGDPLYGGAAAALAPRLALHAERLAWPGGEARAGCPEEIVKWAMG
jgi:RluA family pseudouridine synthase